MVPTLGPTVDRILGNQGSFYGPALSDPPTLHADYACLHGIGACAEAR